MSARSIATAGDDSTRSDREIARELFAELAELAEDDPSRQRVRDQLVEMHLPLVEYLARRFAGRGEPLDDLVQVGTIGLIKAVDRFDPERGVEFSTYATPTVVGEIKRHFRDKGWTVRVPRRLQELRASLSSATSDLTQKLGRSPTVAELAAHLKIGEEEVLEGLESANAYTAVSIDGQRRRGRASVADTLGAEDTSLEGVEYRESIKPLLDALPPRERRILHAAVLRQHDPVADRGGARHLADARVPAAGPHAGPAPRAPDPSRSRAYRSLASASRASAVANSSTSTATASTSTGTPISGRPLLLASVQPTGSATIWTATTGERAGGLSARSARASSSSATAEDRQQQRADRARPGRCRRPTSAGEHDA